MVKVPLSKPMRVLAEVKKVTRYKRKHIRFFGPFVDIAGTIFKARVAKIVSECQLLSNLHRINKLPVSRTIVVFATSTHYPVANLCKFHDVWSDTIAAVLTKRKSTDPTAGVGRMAVVVLNNIRIELRRLAIQKYFCSS